jgi:hypothetical protein
MNNPSPDKVYGPQIADLLRRFCREIALESNASGIRISAEFIYRNGKGDLNMKSFTTPDGKTERMLDSEVLMPRGSKLAHDAYACLRNSFMATATALEQDTGKKQTLFERMAKELLTESPKLSLEAKTRRWMQILNLLQPPLAR